MKLKYVILEDEPLAADKLESGIQAFRPHWQCMGVIQSVREAKKRLPALDAQLLFLDVHLADDLSFSIFEELPLSTPIIFTTAYDQYALRAFKLNSVDYLLKPVSDKELLKAVEKFEANAVVNPNLQKLAQSYQPDYRNRFLVSTGNRIKTILEKDVAYFHANGKHSYLVNTAGKEFLFNQPLSKLIRELNPAVFFQINRQYILALNSIREMIPYSKGRLKVLTQPPTPEEAIVSVEKSPRFRQWVGG